MKNANLIFNFNDFLFHVNWVGLSGLPFEFSLNPKHLIIRTAERIEKFQLRLRSSTLQRRRRLVRQSLQQIKVVIEKVVRFDDKLILIDFETWIFYPDFLWVWFLDYTWPNIQQNWLNSQSILRIKPIVLKFIRSHNFYERFGKNSSSFERLATTEKIPCMTKDAQFRRELFRKNQLTGPSGFRDRVRPRQKNSPPQPEE